jgi:hypothetical protein
MTKRQIALDVLKTKLNLPYIWGGNDSIAGFDCSGLIVEVLKSVGIVAENFDNTAQGLSKMFPETDIIQAGTIVYWDWNGDGLIDHCEMVVSVDESDYVYTIGASGGNSSTTSRERAIIQNAYVRVRPLRAGYVLANDPF